MMMPVFPGSVLVERNQVTCLLPDREVVISAPGRLLAALVRRCDGRTSRAEILEDLGRQWDSAELGRLIDQLATEGVLCDARDLAMRWWAHIKNPLPISVASDLERRAALPVEAARRISEKCPDTSYRHVDGSRITALLEKRESIRTYADRPVVSEVVLRLLWAAYGARAHRTVPSAGEIYPLQIDYVNLRPTDDLPIGLYRVNYLDDGQIGLRCTGGDIRDIWRAWCDPEILSHAQGIVVVSGDIGRTAIAYGNRAALLVPIEAGHVSQNILLCVAEAGIAAAESTDFFEDRLGATLGNEDGVLPLTSVVFGSMPSSQDRALASESISMEFHWFTAETPTYSVPFSVAAARPRDTAIDWCWGRAIDPAAAHTSAIAEAQERLACLSPTDLYRAAARDLPRFVEPRTIVAYSQEQYARADFPFTPFDREASVSWKDGLDVFTGKSVSILADHVYFPRSLGADRPYTAVSSSGAAAYTAEEGALERAVLELVERDAFMTAWLDRLPRPTVDPASMPTALAVRLRRLREAGIQVFVKDFSRDATPVLLVAGQSEEYGFTRVTAASHYDPEQALDRALGELEIVVASRLGMKAPGAIEPSAVVTPKDHGDLYSQRRYFRRADFLFRSGDETCLSKITDGKPRDWSQLAVVMAERYGRLIWLDLTPRGASLRQGRVPLVVGRAIVPGLIPIGFGAGREPLGSWDIRLAGHGKHRRFGPGRSTAFLFPHPFS